MSSGTAPPDPRIRNGLVEIMKNGAKIGIGTSDPNKRRTEWWLIEQAEGPTWNFAVDDLLTFNQLGPAITRKQLLDNHAPGMANPVLYEMGMKITRVLPV